ncbi:GNAT family N-acetyltransferase [Acetatifactor aquisgranensis]|uniref:GNAT family N-acetyltransferase n=1 Tax=Acetatifactor aquisgranensis TaxID=2941233 RepID=UPI00203CC2BC|nr:GNAT family N-acetyltransferase [Acetatifactor aquisgranensis]
MDIQIDITDTVLETRRLILRPWEESDLEDFYAYASVEGVGEMAGWRHHESIEVSRSILEDFMSHKNVFALVHRESGRAIGSLGLHPSWANEDEAYRDLKMKEIGYVLSREYWGQGLMPEAVRAVIGFCFDTCGLDALTVGHFSVNGQSKRVIEKCGFQFVKESRYHAKQLGKDFDDMRYILLR